MSRMLLYATMVLISLSAAALSGCTLRDHRNTGQRFNQGAAGELQVTETLTPSTGLAEPVTILPSAEESTLAQDQQPIASPTPDPSQVLEELMGELTELETLLGATQSWEVELP